MLKKKTLSIFGIDSLQLFFSKPHDDIYILKSPSYVLISQFISIVSLLESFSIPKENVKRYSLPQNLWQYQLKYQGNDNAQILIL